MKKSMQFRLVLFLSTNILLLTAFFGLVMTLHAEEVAECHTFEGSDDAISIARGYGLPYNVLSGTEELLISVECGEEPTVTVGSGESTMLIHKYGHEFTEDGWRRIRFTGDEKFGEWYVGKAQAYLTRPNDTNRYLVLAYTCQLTESGWKCGCQDEVCAQPGWQMQGYKYAETPVAAKKKKRSGGGGGSKVSNGRVGGGGGSSSGGSSSSSKSSGSSGGGGGGSSSPAPAAAEQTTEPTTTPTQEVVEEQPQQQQAPVQQEQQQAQPEPQPEPTPEPEPEPEPQPQQQQAPVQNNSNGDSPPPWGGYGDIELLPIDAQLPSVDECLARVHRSSWEPRPQNNDENYNTSDLLLPDGIDGTPPDRKQFYLDRIDAVNRADVTGTTDELIQFFSCYWGVDDEQTRARASVESSWDQDVNGDVVCNGTGVSWGLLQVQNKTPRGCSPAVHDFAYPDVFVSTANNLNYALAWTAACYRGDMYTWVPGEHMDDPYTRNRECIAMWFSGQWKQGNHEYLGKYDDLFNRKPWLSEGFVTQNVENTCRDDWCDNLAQD